MSKTTSGLERLVTKEDPWFLHKIIGALALFSYAWRLSRAFFRHGDDMGFASHPAWTLPTLVLHVALGISSFIFRIPAQRITTDGGRIWPEYRLHSFWFSARSMGCIALNWYEKEYGSIKMWAVDEEEGRMDNRNGVINLWIVFAGLVAADLSSYSVGPYHSNSVRDLAGPFLVKYYFSVMQFYATAVILFGFRQRSSLYWYITFVIQITAFLMTLRRKNIVSHAFNLVVYGLLLASGLVTGIYECFAYKCGGGSPTDDGATDGFAVVAAVSGVACTASLWRMGPPWLDHFGLRNKYLIWTVLYFVLDRIVQPALRNDKTIINSASTTGGSIVFTRFQLICLGCIEFALMIGYGIYKSPGILTESKR